MSESPLRAMRSEPAIVAALLAVGGVAWFWTAQRMAGMDGGPGTPLGSLGWFTGIWVTMMAAMMLPSLAPTAAVFSATARRDGSRILLFAAGYLLVWSVVGLAAYGLFELGSSLFAGTLAWHRGGRWLVASVLLVAALYELTPAKRAFLSRCRGSLPFSSASRKATRGDAFALGARSGGSCLGCTWALMAALFALGVMSLAWMGMIAALVAIQKIGPWGRGARLASAAILVLLAVAILLVPHEIPGFVVPGSPAAPSMEKMMG